MPSVRAWSHDKALFRREVWTGVISQTLLKRSTGRKLKRISVNVALNIQTHENTSTIIKTT